LNLSKHDFIQQKTADFKKIPLLIEICDQYPIVYDVLWALSFNQDIQQQLRSSSTFMSKLAHFAKENDDEQMRKVTHGLLWNLKSHHKDLPTPENSDGKSFDIMISYSHKDKILCQQIYEELIKTGSRVWIDFDQMHGNVMDAMAQAIERSHTVIICMSEDYRKSNYCRAEAHYAFQRQCKIVPVLLQKHYKPDGWLLFLIGQLLYVDFIKHEFSRAMEMLFKELRAEVSPDVNVLPVQPVENTDVAPHTICIVSSLNGSASLTFSENILEWTQTQVQDWLIRHNLVQMSRLLTDYDGRSLVYLSKYMKSCQTQQILNLLQKDSLRRTKEDVSLIELSRFHSLMDEQNRLIASSFSMKTKTNSVRKNS